MRGLGETFFNGAVIAKYLPALLGGFRVTLALAAAVVTIALALLTRAGGAVESHPVG